MYWTIDIPNLFNTCQLHNILHHSISATKNARANFQKFKCKRNTDLIAMSSKYFWYFCSLIWFHLNFYLWGIERNHIYFALAVGEIHIWSFSGASNWILFEPGWQELADFWGSKHIPWALLESVNLQLVCDKYIDLFIV